MFSCACAAFVSRSAFSKSLGELAPFSLFFSSFLYTLCLSSKSVLAKESCAFAAAIEALALSMLLFACSTLASRRSVLSVAMICPFLTYMPSVSGINFFPSLMPSCLMRPMSWKPRSAWYCASIRPSSLMVCVYFSSLSSLVTTGVTLCRVGVARVCIVSLICICVYM